MHREVQPFCFRPPFATVTSPSLFFCTPASAAYSDADCGWQSDRRLNFYPSGERTAWPARSGRSRRPLGVAGCADDFVMGFACEEDARRLLEVLPRRFGNYGLALHPDKTRLVPFQ